jgi:Rrf2 family nitric oxide-sensitive transcriptional repressor
MHLTQQTDYALRVLMYLALSRERRVTVSELSERLDIARNHLTKIVHRLAREGLVLTVRGPQGGVTLAKEPATIQVGHVVRRTEPTLKPVDCQQPGCPLASACRLASVWERARDAFLRELDDCSVADLVVNRHELFPLLELTDLDSSTG